MRPGDEFGVKTEAADPGQIRMERLVYRYVSGV